jgi:hypothetical protein
MTGFLYRLAERAMGTAQPLRKVSSTLFAPTLAEEVSRPADTMAAATVEVTPSTPVQPVQPGQNRAQTGSVQSAQRREAATAGGETAVDPAVTAHSQAVLENPTVLQHPGQTYISQPANTRPPMLVPSVPGAGQNPAAATTIQSGWPVRAHLKMDAEPPESLRPLPTLAASIEPLLPLVPPARQPFRGTASASTANQGSLPAGMVEETTEVHVSIGRIEVTAVHEPAPSKPAAPRRNAPMSLDEYLARRHGGRS